MKKFPLLVLATLAFIPFTGCDKQKDDGVVIVEPDPDDGPGTDPAPDPREGEYLVGCAYFAGFHEQTGSYNYPHTTPAQSWKEDFPGRLPLNPAGIYTNANSVYYDIEDAANHGVDFFSILWYPNAEAEPGVDNINKAVGWFMDSPNADRMKFMIEVTNHAPFDVQTVAGWEEIALWAAGCMHHGSYLKVDGRPVLKIHGAGTFIDDLGGPAPANEALTAIRRTIMEQGLENPIIAIGLTGDISVSGSRIRDLAVDVSMQYNDPGDHTYDPALLSFDLLTGVAERDMLTRVDDIVPHVPFINVGWDGRPWLYQNYDPPMPSYMMPTRAQWKAALEMMKANLDAQDNFGFPVKSGPRQKAFTIFAWNEFGEGGYLAPTADSGYMKLEVVKEVFAAN